MYYRIKIVFNDQIKNKNSDLAMKWYYNSYWTIYLSCRTDKKLVSLCSPAATDAIASYDPEKEFWKITLDNLEEFTCAHREQ